MTDRIEIALQSTNGEPVSLKAMDQEALDSFISVVASLKELAKVFVANELLTYSIKEGSAACAVEAPTHQLDSMFQEINSAIKGNSHNKEIVAPLRRIQEQIKRKSYSYNFRYHQQGKVVQLDPTLRDSDRIIQRRGKSKYEYKFKILTGFINQIGGKDPNYHFDYGAGERIKISCTIEQADDIKDFLYQTITSFVVTKEWYLDDKKDQHTHVAILDTEMKTLMRDYIAQYFKEQDLISKLSITYDFVDKLFLSNKTIAINTLKYLLMAFNSKYFHLSELKTILVISKPFKNNEVISKYRQQLIETYEALKTKEIF